ncbi:outer membrane beta-barrel protein [Sabulicella glaciei]|uniref:Outer membrane beta-barrel protein n=1 Tax=Sabulicella glaciei TaxID=2984948 RepID=A0ABT3P1M0_9PROT|nr:outer membrane beta-barrel protein [Roseococcus sp. MDT2-1-1]MCW8088088.1 outer membrane beta-barrel protein [Roseococcus sp. MDT2-1-1]
MVAFHPEGASALRRSAGAAALAMVLLGAPAELRGQGSTPDWAATARGVTVQTRPRPDYEPLGVRLGAFRLDGSLEAGPGFDDNPAPNLRGSRAQATLEEALSLGLASGWTRHAFTAALTQQTRRYPSDPSLSWNDYAFDLGGRLDIGRASSLGLLYSRQRNHFDLGNFDLQRAGLARPVQFDSDVFRLRGVGALNRLLFEGGLEHRTFRYDRTVGAGGAVGSDRDHLTAEAGASYLFQPGQGLDAVARLTRISYQQSSQRGRDSLTYEVLGGLRYDFNGLWGVRLSLGYRRRVYEDPSIRALSGPAFDAQVTWMPSQVATLGLSAQRTIEESIRPGSVAYTRTALRTTLDYEVRRNIIATVTLGAEMREYERPRERVVDGVATFGATMLLNRRAALLLNYQHTRRFEAPSGFREYGRNILSLRLRLSL